MYILGISCYYHDAAAALLKNGKIAAAAEEERFTRKKHDLSFPINAVRYCLERENISIDKIRYIGFYEKPILKFERVLSQQIDTFPRSYKSFLGSSPSWIAEKLRLIPFIKKKLGYKGDVLFINHHISHAASCFLLSPFEDAAIFTADGVGEWATTSLAYGKGKDIRVIKTLEFPHSLGLLYSTITSYLGFRVNNSEYKVMGLSAYGNMDKASNPYYRKLKQAIDVKDDGSFSLDMSFFKYHYTNRMPSKKMCNLLGGNARKKEELGKRHKDIAAALQLITEEVVMKCLAHLQEETGCENLAMAGGVALNSVCNGKILKNTGFKNIWIQPAAGDSGGCIGAAAYIYNSFLGKDRQRFYTAYLGPSFSRIEIKRFLDENKIKYSFFDDEKELLAKTAKLIHENNVVAWFQGRMEFGPRALGARSILANPCNPDAQELLNRKVKHRESFRPFAPAVCKEDAEEYFECDSPLPLPCDFMLMVYPVRENWRKSLPSVVHVDGTARLQTIARNQNKLYYDLIKEFGKLSGIPILINTSFNINGEPIVCTPYDAYRCMMGTEIDFLVMDRFLIMRKENPEHIWDSQTHIDG